MAGPAKAGLVPDSDQNVKAVCKDRLFCPPDIFAFLDILSSPSEKPEQEHAKNNRNHEENTPVVSFDGGTHLPEQWMNPHGV